MRVFANKNMIVIHVERDSLNERVIQNFVNRYFNHKIQGRSGVVIYHDDDEIATKKMFFNWLYLAYTKTNGRDSLPLKKELETALNRPIKIKWVGSAEIIHSISVTIDIININYLKFSFKPDNMTAHLHNFMRTYFKPHAITNTIDRDQYLIKINSDDVKEKLTKLLKRTRIMHYSVSFSYNKYQLSQLLAHSNSYLVKEETDREKIDKAYKLLNVSPKEELSEIKRRFKKLLYKYHPDRVYNQGKAVIEKYTLTFQSIQTAFEYIQADKSGKTRLRAS